MQMREWRFLFTPENSTDSDLIIAATVRNNTFTLYTGPHTQNNLTDVMRAVPLLSYGYRTNQIRYVHRVDSDHSLYHSSYDEVSIPHSHIMFQNVTQISPRQIKKLLLQMRAQYPATFPKIPKEVIKQCIKSFKNWQSNPSPPELTLASNSPNYSIPIAFGKKLSIRDHMYCLELASDCNEFNPRTPTSFLLYAPATQPYNIGNLLIATFTLGAIAVSAHALRKSGLFGNTANQETKEVKTEVKKTDGPSVTQNPPTLTEAGTPSTNHNPPAGPSEQPSSLTAENTPNSVENKFTPSA